jgi:hypothetical protein
MLRSARPTCGRRSAWTRDVGLGKSESNEAQALRQYLSSNPYLRYTEQQAGVPRPRSYLLLASDVSMDVE